MPIDWSEQLNDSRVARRNLLANHYDFDEIRRALGELGENLGWANEKSAFGKIIEAGAKVTIKPNFVLHWNQSGGTLDSLVTHETIIRAVAEEVLKTDAREITVGDAPIQACDFQSLLSQMKLDVWAADLQKKDKRFKGIKDFRRTVSLFKNGVREAQENMQPLENFVLFDLAENSLLEEITNENSNFRVTNYDPRRLAETHRRGKHQFLVARDIIEADVVINLPKLKTHKKAGITNALKNLIGINGNKEFLPHHRLGGAKDGGDCYPEKNTVKRALEFVYDRQNMTNSAVSTKSLATVGRGLQKVLHLQGDETGLEGSWSGNETIWRTCLDLNRVLLYGKADTTISKQLQRKVLHISDAVIAGQGDGPLASEDLPLGILLAGRSAAAMDFVGAFLLGYDAEKIALVREAFGAFDWRLTNFAKDEIKLIGDWETGEILTVLRDIAKNAEVKFPAGWRDAAIGTI